MARGSLSHQPEFWKYDWADGYGNWEFWCIVYTRSLYSVLLLYTSFAVLRPAAADREQAFPAFMEWLHKNGVDTSAVEIHSFPGCGYGLKAVKDIKVKQSVCLSVTCVFPITGISKFCNVCFLHFLMLFVDGFFFKTCFCRLVLINWTEGLTIPVCPGFMCYCTPVQYRKYYVQIFLCFLLCVLNA